MTGPVICGLDDSTGDGAAADVARALAERFELPLLFVHVLPPEPDEADSDAAARLVCGAAEASDGVDAGWRLEHGHPADRLVAVAGDRDASFAVVGCHGPRSSLLGSISADVSRRAPCPVVVVPPAAAPRAGAHRSDRSTPAAVGIP